MSFRRLSVVIGAAVLMSAAAGAAHAAGKPSRPIDFTVKAEPTALAAPNAGQTVKYDASKGRFGVTLNMQESNVRPATLSDVQAGAYFRITPSLRVGGSVTLGDTEAAPRFKATPAQPAEPPKVRLETKFKF